MEQKPWSPVPLDPANINTKRAINTVAVPILPIQTAAKKFK
jgi:hypothetical protein